MTSERAKELQQLQIWGEFASELDSLIATETIKLLNCTPEGLYRIQEKIGALRFIKELPRHIADRDV
jgi:hypothetical protein